MWFTDSKQNFQACQRQAVDDFGKGCRGWNHFQNQQSQKPTDAWANGQGRHADRRGSKLRAKDVDDRKLLVASPKSGRQSEIVFIPKKIADRLKDYIRFRELTLEQRVLPLGYTGAREIVKKAGRLVGIDLRPHDLRRHAATYASRAGAPLEIVSKLILAMKLYRPHSFTLEKSVIQKPSGGLKTFLDKK